MALAWWWSSLRATAPEWRPLLLLLLLQQTLSPGSLLVHGLPSCPRSCTCQAAKEVHCTFRHLTSIPKTFPPDTERVNLGYNSLTEVEGSEFRSLRKLEMLMLHGNDISAVHSGAFYNLRSLQILKMSYNKLTEVDAGLFQGLVGLVRLHLDHNLISFIQPYSFSGLPALKLLQLEGNVLRDLHPHTFITLSLLGTFWSSGLRHLHLSDNLLEQLPAAVLQTAPRLEVLSLHGNPWSCDCQLRWLLDWNSRHEGVIKCKKERGAAETCAQCSSPPLNGSRLLDLTPDQLSCQRPTLNSPLKRWDSPMWVETEAEPDLPYTRDLEKPLGQLTFVLSDSHGNSAHVLCDVQRPGEGVAMTWSERPGSPGEVSVNVSLATVLQCEIDREALHNLWRLVAYYYESPAILERGAPRDNANSTTYQYAQAINENSPYFTDLKGYLTAEPGWLLQHRVTLQLNRRQTTNKNLVMDFSTLISEDINTRPRQGDGHGNLETAWALIRRGTAGQVQSVLEGTKAQLECDVITSGSQVKVEWMHPDLSVIEGIDGKSELLESGQLVILNTTLADAGLYHCMVKTQAGIDLVPMRLTVKQRSLSPSAFNGEKMSVKKGQTLSLPCNVTTVEPSRTVWYLPKNRILLPTQQARRAEVLANGTLVVKKMSQDEAGEYSCMASNIYGVDMISHQVEVTEEQKPTEQKEVGPTVLVNAEEEGEGSGAGSGQSSSPRLRKGPGLFPFPTYRPRSGVTNRPEITADTAKPTASLSTKSQPASSPPPALTPNHYHPGGGAGGWSHPNPGSDTQTRDYLMYSKLRNRYRQAQLDRIAQLGRRLTLPITPKPHLIPHHHPSSSGNHKPHILPLFKPYPNPNPKTPVPTPALNVPSTLKPIQPAIPPFSSTFDLSPTLLPRPNTTPVLFYGSRWPSIGGRISSRRPTAVPPFPGPMDAVGSGAGYKPLIATAATTSVSALAESDVYLPCKVKGHPAPTIAWTKVSTGASIPAGTQHGLRFEVFKNGTFVIKNVQLQDRGQYLCTARNSFGSDRVVITLAVQTEPPKIHPPTSREVAVYLGRDVHLHCLTSGKPPAKISWILPNRALVRDVGSAQTPQSPVALLSNGTLHIQSANFSSKGDYKCIASNAAGADTVTYNLHVAALPPSINEDPSEAVRVQPGMSVYVHCSAKGEPEPVLKWTIPGGVHVKPSQFLGRRLFVFPNGTLYVKNAALADGGNYECSAKNAVGIAKRTVQLVVRTEAPAFPPPPPPTAALIPRPHEHDAIPRPSQHHLVSAMYGSTVFLHCPESTESTRGTIWQLPSKTIMDQYSPERSITVFRNGTLRIIHLTEIDRGNYLCLFQRPNGEDMELFQVDVLMTAPKIEHLRPMPHATYGQNFQVDCVASGLPNPEVSWSLPDGTVINNALQSDDSGVRNRRFVIFDNGTLLLQQMGKKDEGDYTCHAKNHLGRDERKVKVTVTPDAPKISPESHLLATARLGESAQFVCQATGEPRPRILWISPGHHIISVSSDRYQVMENGVLVVKRVTLADEGKYTCIARNPIGEDVKNFQMEVESQEPSINGITGRSTSRVLAVSYQTTQLDCKAEANPEPRVSWITPYGQQLPAPYAGGRFQVHPNGSLELRGVRKTDEGRYACLAKNTRGEATFWVELEVASIAEKPSFAVPNIEMVPIKQDSREIVLECPARGKPHPEFAWILPNRTMLPPGRALQRFVHHLGNGTLRISHPVANDKGVYRCVAKNVAGQAEKRYTLEAGRKPVIRGVTGGMKITYGHSLSLPCSVDDWQQASISWTLPNGRLLDKPQHTGRLSFFNNGTLQLKEVATFDKGTYVCKASNTFGSHTLSYPVTVMVFPPRITKAPASVTRIHRGSPVTLGCLASGVPKPEISWTLPGRTTLAPHSRFTVQGGIHMMEDGSLVIQNPMLTNSGIYKCNAKNALGTDFKSTYLQVI
ncbi:unnamed protein product [Boreogadus saida]